LQKKKHPEAEAAKLTIARIDDQGKPTAGAVVPTV
jgi:hypothetical protein